MPVQEFKPKISIFYSAFCLISVIVSVYAILLLPFGVLIKAILLSTVFLYAWWVFYVAIARRAPFAITQFKHNQDGTWLLLTRCENSLAVLCNDTFFSSFFIVLRFKIIRQKSLTKSYVIFRDSLSQERYRTLLALLRLS